jgi:hypothetical protein
VRLVFSRCACKAASTSVEFVTLSVQAMCLQALNSRTQWQKACAACSPLRMARQRTCPSGSRTCRSMLSRRIRLDIFDLDRGKEQGDSLGWANFNLDLVAEGQVTEQWIQLRNVFAGELRLRVLVLSGTDDNEAVRRLAAWLCSAPLCCMAGSTSRSQSRAELSAAHLCWR